MITNITVLGAGTMGMGIARLFAKHGFQVSLFDPNIQALPESSLHAAEELSIVISSELEKAVTSADLVVEAVPEQLDIKLEVYRKLEAYLPPSAIVASNTSTFSLKELVADLTIADRMIITHFFNPADVVPLVEIVGLPSTAPHIVNEVFSLLQQCGKSPVVLNKDIPGFIANRLQAALMREASYLLENGVADAAQIDTVVTEGLGLRWALKGPFEIADLGGLDIWAKVTCHLFPELSNGSETPESIKQNVHKGKLGVKSGGGYYEYADPSKASEQMAESLQQLVSFTRKSTQEE
ncbi:3-hydroxyacyl-CoA dehydrogenase family protein [Cohnella abietis]|uniref:3-hydroxybutyryl-CoA dehydrogenase n=1 Tax=Cohnella abietis TaxID=2507935 RepID=A0A3T1D2G0_9BACL|nr:3-hydroxyacyl-CoA dehydrogenase NAD-binding domain-containing protein [Cohnella abietis]BBI32292.1 3-hydroxybutyryl-CoA dehydrogenase [Cohnella abietis]